MYENDVDSMNAEQAKRKVPFSQQAAQACLLAPVVALALGIFRMTMSTTNQYAQTITSYVSVGLILIGTLLGIVALFGMIKHGPKRILWRSIVGLTINGFLIIATVTTVQNVSRLREKMTTPQYTFKAPKEYATYDMGEENPAVLETYLKGDPADLYPDVLCVLMDLGGVIQRGDIREHFKERKDLSLVSMKWQRYPIDVVCVHEQVDGVPVTTVNAQIPLTPRAIQIKLMGHQYMEQEMLEDMKGLLLRIDGRSNW